MGNQRVKQSAFGQDLCSSLPFWYHRFNYMKCMEQLPTVIRRKYIPVSEVLEPAEPLSHPWAYTPQFNLLYNHHRDLHRISHTLQQMNLQRTTAP